jgi:circadian clock protein KaiC
MGQGTMGKRTTKKSKETPSAANHPARALRKTPTSVPGLDEVLSGGLPDQRIVAITGGPGTGKTVLALQIMHHRAERHGEAGIFICFEESPARLRENVAGFVWGDSPIWDTHVTLIDGRPASDTMVSGDFDLSGLLAIIDGLTAQTNAKSVVLDGLDALLANLLDNNRERQELLRLARWSADRHVTCMITTKRTSGDAAHHSGPDFLHYITDCVLELDAKLYASSLARTLRVIKYRGSAFAANAFPAVLSSEGFEVVSATSPRLGLQTFTDRIATGIDGLDDLLGGGLRRGTGTLISGAAGTGKTLISAHFASSACAAGEKTLYVSFDEADTQIIADLASVKVDLGRWVASGQLSILSLRSWTRSPEEHFAAIRRKIFDLAPTVLVIDPISALNDSFYPFSAKICQTLFDIARMRGITFVFTSLTDGHLGHQEVSVSNISTIADAWIHLSYNLVAGERNRALSIVKCRGTNHSNQLHELVMNEGRLRVTAPYVGEGEIVMGRARVLRERAEHRLRSSKADAERKRASELKRRLTDLEAKFAAARSELDWTRNEIQLAEAAIEKSLDRSDGDNAWESVDDVDAFPSVDE